MILVFHRHTDPYFNMALEEYFLQTAEEETVFFWRNEPAVIIGRNQNAGEQVNFDFTEAHKIRVVRRLTGGGAVFHDLGNINYTFITPQAEKESIDFARFSKPIIRVLSSLGAEVSLSGRNDLLTAAGKKCSGVAACGYRRNGKTSLLHHGTLLFSADLSALAGALRTDPEKIRSKGIASVQSRVANLRDCLSPEYADMEPETFLSVLEEAMLRDGAVLHLLTEEEEKAVALLAREKYETDAWLFGAAESVGTYKNKRRFEYGTVEVSYSLFREVGFPEKIKDVRFSGDFFGTAPIAGLEAALDLTEFSKSAILQKLEALPIPNWILGACPEEIADLIVG